MTSPPRRRDPARALRAMGAALLGVEALLVLLTSVALRALPAGVRWWQILTLVVLAVALLAGASRQRRPDGPAVGSVLQVLMLAGGFLTWPLFALGVICGVVWLYYLRLLRGIPR